VKRRSNLRACCHTRSGVSADVGEEGSSNLGLDVVDEELATP
jgi:hypothetical protein